MNAFKYYVAMGAAFVALLFVSVYVLELAEGNKITTTEYYGLRNIGFIFLGTVMLSTVFLYPLVVLPMNWLLRKGIPWSAARIAVYALLGGVGGWYLFHGLYDDYFIQGYRLQSDTAVALFGLTGLLYGTIDVLLTRKYGTSRPPGPTQPAR